MKCFENYSELKFIGSDFCTPDLLSVCQTTDTSNSILFTEWQGGGMRRQAKKQSPEVPMRCSSSFGEEVWDVQS